MQQLEDVKDLQDEIKDAYLDMIDEANEKFDAQIEKYETINSEYALNLLSKVYEFGDVVLTSAQRREPHLIANYVYELATSFHSFYAHEKVLTDDSKYTDERINLIASVAITIKNACNLLGVSAPEKM